MNFALQIGKDGLVLETDIKKGPDILWRNAKKNGGGPKGAMGTMTVRGKVIELNCVDDSAPKQLPNLAKKWLTERGQAYKVVMVTPSGAVSDEADEEEPALEGRRREKRDTPEQSTETDADPPEQSTSSETDTPEQTTESDTDVVDGSRQDDEATGPSSILSEPIVLGNEPAKRELAEEFGSVRKELMKVMGQLERDARMGLQEQIAQFGQLMKSKDYKGAQRLMDDLAASQKTVTEPQRSRARDEIAQIDNLVGDIEAEMDALEAALSQDERSTA